MKPKSLQLIVCVLFVCLYTLTSTAQRTLDNSKAYTPQVGVLVSMLEDLKARVTSSVKELSKKETDFLLDKDANRIGAMILHLAATEKYYQVYTFEGREFTEEEMEEWGTALSLGEKARKKYVKKSINYYLKIWNKVRKETLAKLKDKNDEWLKLLIMNDVMSNHWAWYHVMEHQANHMGQIRLIIKRIAK